MIFSFWLIVAYRRSFLHATLKIESFWICEKLSVLFDSLFCAFLVCFFLSVATECVMRNSFFTYVILFRWLFDDGRVMISVLVCMLLGCSVVCVENMRGRMKGTERKSEREKNKNSGVEDFTGTNGNEIISNKENQEPIAVYK